MKKRPGFDEWHYTHISLSLSFTSLSSSYYYYTKLAYLFAPRTNERQSCHAGDSLVDGSRRTCTISAMVSAMSVQ